MYECYEEESCKSKLFNNFGKFTPNFRKNRTKFKLTKTLIHFLRKTKDSLKNLMTGNKTSGKGGKLKTFEKVLTLLKND